MEMLQVAEKKRKIWRLWENLRIQYQRRKATKL